MVIQAGRRERGWISDCRGSMNLLLVGLLLASVFGGLGTLGVLRRWRGHMETQLRLNRCVGQAAQKFRSILNVLFSKNQEIQRLRKAILAASLEPSLLPPLRTALEWAVIEQETLLTFWQVRRQSWSVQQGCEFAQKDHAAPLPELRFLRPPPDLLGAQALEWVGPMPRSFVFLLRHPPRSAAAEVLEDGLGLLKKGMDASHWVADWTVPSRFEGLGL